MTRPRPVSPLWDARRHRGRRCLPGRQRRPVHHRRGIQRRRRLPGRPRPGHRPAAGTARGIRRPDRQENRKWCYEDPSRHPHHHQQRIPARRAHPGPRRRSQPPGPARAELRARIDDHNTEQARIPATYSGGSSSRPRRAFAANRVPGRRGGHHPHKEEPMTDTTSTTQATPAPLSGRIATWVTALRYEDLPEEVVERTKLLILDQLGLQLRGATLPNAQPVLPLAHTEPATAEATLAHSGARTTVSQAAWVNGTLGHSAEYDDAHPLAWHTNSAVIPAALALAERTNASGPDLITAVVAGIQVMGLLGAATPTMVTIGWHGSKVLGVYGAAAAAGRILSLTPGQLVNAFGIAGRDAGR